MLFGKINHQVAIALCAIFVLFSLPSLEARPTHHEKQTHKHKMRVKKAARKARPPQIHFGPGPSSERNVNIHFGPGPNAKKQFKKRIYPRGLRNQNASVSKK
jgi:hypothetical protein